ncbi:UNVERIFIED_CONTAM: hypothetical protein Scaly_2907400 [Sesamum calycinum]|uniref:Reverse transcriptase domain-containing protein n=1 Tax=Sesamum calycinum TaxID=2727403 RepID=A0AAW2L399_9LAMI
MLSLRHYLMSHIHYRVGNGESVSLWHDPWHPLGPLISRFPRGPQLTRTGLLDKLSVVIKDGQWNWPLITDIACLEITYMLPPFLEGPDRISWKSKDGSFNTSTAYDLFHPPGPKGLAFCARMEYLRHMITFSFHALFPAVALPLSDSRSHSHGPIGIGNMERNARRFQQRSRPPSFVGRLVVEEIRQRIISIPLRHSVSSIVPNTNATAPSRPGSERTEWTFGEYGLTFYTIGPGLRTILVRLGGYGWLGFHWRRDLWGVLRTLSAGILEEPWLVLGDFNAVIDDSEVCGRAADTSASMAEFRSCIFDTGLVQLPSTGCPFTWHNCSEGTRSLWKRLDRMLVNEAWLEAWPDSSYICALPSTSDHSPLVLTGTHRDAEHAIFRFDNYLARQPGFLELVTNIWQHHIVGTAMYEVVCKLKALKADFRRQRQRKGNLTENVKMAKRFLDKAQTHFATYKEDRLSTSSTLGGTSPHRVVDLDFLRSDLKHTLSIDEANLLDAPVTQSDIKDAFFAIDEDSAPERSISDNILLAQELLAGYNQVRLPQRCTLKVDIQKAYDSVEWDFLWAVLRLFGFPPRFIVLIEQCVSTATFSVALNGSVHGFFKGSRGLRQGRPSSIQVLRDTLTEFAALSGLNVNPAKSQIILSRAVQQERRQIVEYLGFQEGSLPVRYLGVPLTSSRLTIADCRPLINRIDTQLAGWNQHNLSYAGRVQLIKGNAKVAWDQICKPKEEGGLGIRSMLAMNQALMLKHLWRILQNDGTSIWVDWIQHYRLRNSTIWTFNYGLCCKAVSVTSVLQQDQWRWPASTEADIAEIISQLPPTNPTTSDQICWRNSAGKFTVQSAILLIQPATMQVQWHGLLRGKFKIARHCFVLWLAILEKLSTLDKPWISSDNDGCVLCDGHFGETHGHLFFECWYSRRCLSILKTRIKFSMAEIGMEARHYMGKQTMEGNTSY